MAKTIIHTCDTCGAQLKDFKDGFILKGEILEPEKRAMRFEAHHSYPDAHTMETAWCWGCFESQKKLGP